MHRISPPAWNRALYQSLHPAIYSFGVRRLLLECDGPLPGWFERITACNHRHPFFLITRDTMQATTILMNEHRLIEQVLSCLEAMVDAGSEQGRIDESHARDAVTFLREFADGRHHAKEEERLFPLMESRGFTPQEGPTAVMRMEHTQGRDWIGKIEASIPGAAAGDADDVREFSSAARCYVELLRQHIEKEDHCLFPMAEQMLGADEQGRLSQSFAAFEQGQAADEALDRLQRIADNLADSYSVPRATVTTVG